MVFLLKGFYSIRYCIMMKYLMHVKILLLSQLFQFELVFLSLLSPCLSVSLFVTLVTDLISPFLFSSVLIIPFVCSMYLSLCASFDLVRIVSVWVWFFIASVWITDGFKKDSLIFLAVRVVYDRL